MFHVEHFAIRSPLDSPQNGSRVEESQARLFHVEQFLSAR
jgi:hypothetical protein